MRKQSPPSPSISPVKLPPKTKIRQKSRDYDSTDIYEEHHPSPSSSPVKLPQMSTKSRPKVGDYDSTDVYEEQTEDEMIDIDPSVTDADEGGGYFRNLAKIRLAIF